MDFSKLVAPTQINNDPLKDLFNFKRENERMRPIEGTYAYVLKKFALIQTTGKRKYPALVADLLITQAIPEKEIASGTAVSLFWGIGDTANYADVYAKQRAADFVRALFGLPQGVDVSAKSLALIDESQPGAGRLITITATQISKNGKQYPDFQYTSIAQTPEQIVALRAQLGLIPLTAQTQTPVTAPVTVSTPVVAAPNNPLGSWITQSLGVPVK